MILFASSYIHLMLLPLLSQRQFHYVHGSGPGILRLRLCEEAHFILTWGNKYERKQPNGQEPSFYDPEAQLTKDLIMDQKGATFHLALWLIEQVLLRFALKDQGCSSLRHHISLMNHAETVCQIRPMELLPNNVTDGRRNRSNKQVLNERVCIHYWYNRTGNQMQLAKQAINPFCRSRMIQLSIWPQDLDRNRAI
ncbi:hypothetical protein VNO77_22386 [Canavalia gladiata]|uniref:Uncharacterized protein n=1 Tax=Canavalia gladiata TaxID=3824 RepID=A0AAN9L7P8_CANGL